MTNRRIQKQNAKTYLKELRAIRADKVMAYISKFSSDMKTETIGIEFSKEFDEYIARIKYRHGSWLNVEKGEMQKGLTQDDFARGLITVRQTVKFIE